VETGNTQSLYAILGRIKMKHDITQHEKELTKRRTELALMVEIPDIAAYAVEWSKLGAEFDAAGWHNNAAICYSNAERYGAMDQGAYERLLQEFPVTLKKNENLKECKTCGTFTKHVALATPEGRFIGWMCGCGEFSPATTAELVTVP
jgi:hypothetical protein